jgi:hypothetical protein
MDKSRGECFFGFVLRRVVGCSSDILLPHCQPPKALLGPGFRSITAPCDFVVPERSIWELPSLASMAGLPSTKGNVGSPTLVNGRDTRIYLDLIRLTHLLERTIGKPEIKVGLIDGPVLIDHRDLIKDNTQKVPGESRGSCAAPPSAACKHENEFRQGAYAKCESLDVGFRYSGNDRCGRAQPEFQCGSDSAISQGRSR